MASDPRALLQRAAATPSGALPMGAVLRRAASLRRRRRATVMACVAGLMIAGSLGLAKGWPESSVGPSSPERSPSPGGRTTTIKVSGFPSEVAVGAGSVWAANTTDDGVTVTRIDESTGAIEAEIPIPGFARSVTFGDDGNLWLFVERGNGRRVVVVDPVQNEVVASTDVLFRTNITESHDSIAAGESAGFVAHRGKLYRMERSATTPSELAVTTLDLPRPFRVADRDSGPYAVTFADGSVFAAKGNGRIVRVDPATAQPLGEQRLDWNFINMARGSASLWVSHASRAGRHRLFRLGYDDFGSSADRMDVDLGKYDQYWTVRVGGPSLWVVRSASGQNVVELEEGTGAEIGRRRVPVGSFFGAAASDDALWVVDRGNKGGTVTRIPSAR